MRKYLAIAITLIGLISCKTQEIVQPNNIDLETINSIENNIVIQAEELTKAFAFVSNNDSIKNTLFLMCGKGVDGYFWVPLEALENELMNKYSINLPALLNKFINKNKNSVAEYDYYSEYKNNANNNNFNLHLAIPRLNEITNSKFNDLNTLDIETNNIKNINRVYFASYLMHDSTSELLNTYYYSDNKIILNKYSKSNLGIEPLVFVSYKIIDYCVIRNCVDEFSKNAIENCIFYEPYCKICPESMSHNNQIYNQGTGGWTGSELRIRLGNPYFDNQNLFPCHNNVIYKGPNISDLNGFGTLSSVYNLTYYHPMHQLVAGTSKYNVRLLKTDRPIRVFKYEENSTPVIKDATKFSLCYSENSFYTLNDGNSSGQGLAGGIYKINRLNGNPLYLYFPVHIYGGMMWIDAADNVIDYSLIHQRNIFCNYPTGTFAVQEKMINSSGCKYCISNIFGLNQQHFVNTNLKFLIDYWEKEEIIVGVGYVHSNAMPTNNYKVFEGQITSTNCNISVPNSAIKVAELYGNSEEIDQFVHFNQEFPTNTQFLIKVLVNFKSGKTINKCEIINSLWTIQNNGISGVAILPKGGINNLHIEVYKL